MLPLKLLSASPPPDPQRDVYPELGISVSLSEFLKMHREKCNLGSYWMLEEVAEVTAPPPPTESLLKQRSCETFPVRTWAVEEVRVTSPCCPWEPALVLGFPWLQDKFSLCLCVSWPVISPVTQIQPSDLFILRTIILFLFCSSLPLASPWRPLDHRSALVTSLRASFIGEAVF